MDKVVLICVFLVVFVISAMVSGVYFTNQRECKNLEVAMRICKDDARCKVTVEDLQHQVRCAKTFGAQP